jgi:hypothetical protein
MLPLLISWFCALFSAACGQLLMFLKDFLSFGAKMTPQNTYWAVYTFQENNNTGSGSFLMHSQGLNFVHHFPGSLWTFIKVSMCISFNRKTKIAPKAQFGTVSLPVNKNTWKIDHFWCTSNGWNSWHASW